MNQVHATPAALSIDETARRLSLSRSTVLRHIAAGRLRAVRLGRRVLVPASAIAALLGEPGAPPEAWHG